MINLAGKIASWLTLFLVFVFCVDVVLRYLFNATQVWVIDLEWHLFGVIILLSGGYALLEDRHVRVDIFFNRLSEGKQDLLTLFGHVFLLIPWVVMIIYAASKYALYSFNWREGSPDPGGLPARYIIKTFIVLGFILFLLAGLKQIYHLIRKLMTSKE